MDILLIDPITRVVDNCISADSLERAALFYPNFVCLDRPDGSPLGPGWCVPAEGEPTPPPSGEAAPLRILSRLEFLRRMPAAVRIAIRNAAKTDPIIDDALQLLDLASEVRLDDPDTVALVGYLQLTGHLTAADAARLLAD